MYFQRTWFFLLPCAFLFTGVLANTAHPANTDKLISSSKTTSAYLARRAIQARQFRYGSKSSHKKREEAKSCPPLPLPTLGCQSCATCRDQAVPYCASPSNDENSCGTCITDIKQCETGSSCTNGVCSTTCDKPGYLGETAGQCRDATELQYMQCPLTLADGPGCMLVSANTNMDADGRGTGTVYCQYDCPSPNTYETGVLLCYNSGSSGQNTYSQEFGSFTGSHKCDTSIGRSGTTGMGCGSTASCPRTVMLEGSQLDLQNGGINKYLTPAGTYAYEMGCYYAPPNYSSYVYCGWDQTTGNPSSPYGADAAGHPLDAATVAAICGDHLDIAMDSYCLDDGENTDNGPHAIK